MILITRAATGIFAALISISTAFANTMTVAITNRLDIRCITGDCKEFCLDNNGNLSLLISSKCDSNKDIIVPLGETRILTLQTDSDLATFCLEDGYQQTVHTRSTRLIYVSWRGFQQVKAVGLFPYHQFAGPVFGNQVTSTDCSVKRTSTKKSKK